MNRIAVLDDWQGVARDLADWSRLEERADVSFLEIPIRDASELEGFDVVAAMRERTRLSADIIDALPDLRLLTFTGARNAAVDVEACTRRGVVVCFTESKGSSHATAELALGLMLAQSRGIAMGDAEIRAGRFQERTTPGVELSGRVLGLVGLGKIGGRMARYASALDMTVIAWSENLTAERADEVGAHLVTKEQLFAHSDVVSLHLVLSERTRGIVGATDIARMKPGAALINTSRSGLVDQDALIAALHENRITAALDVYDEEPLPESAAIRTVPNATLSPHLGYVTQDNMRDFYRQTVENIEAWLDGKPIRVMNPHVLNAQAENRETAS